MKRTDTTFNEVLSEVNDAEKEFNDIIEWFEFKLFNLIFQTKPNPVQLSTAHYSFSRKISLEEYSGIYS